MTEKQLLQQYTNDQKIIKKDQKKGLISNDLSLTDRGRQQDYITNQFIKQGICQDITSGYISLAVIAIYLIIVVFSGILINHLLWSVICLFVFGFSGTWIGALIGELIGKLKYPTKNKKH